MNIQKFNKRISVKRYTTEKTTTGGIKTTGSTTLFTCWAKVTSITGNKRLEYTSMNYNDPKQIIIRKRSTDILTTDVIVISSIDYEIISMYETEDERFIILEVRK